jgi:hypothetical protein
MAEFRLTPQHKRWLNWSELEKTLPSSKVGKIEQRLETILNNAASQGTDLSQEHEFWKRVRIALNNIHQVSSGGGARTTQKVLSKELKQDGDREGRAQVLGRMKSGIRSGIRMRSVIKDMGFSVKELTGMSIDDLNARPEQFIIAHCRNWWQVFTEALRKYPEYEPEDLWK